MNDRLRHRREREVVVDVARASHQPVRLPTGARDLSAADGDFEIARIVAQRFIRRTESFRRVVDSSGHVAKTDLAYIERPARTQLLHLEHHVMECIPVALAVSQVEIEVPPFRLEIMRRFISGQFKRWQPERRSGRKSRRRRGLLSATGNQGQGA